MNDQTTIPQSAGVKHHLPEMLKERFPKSYFIIAVPTGRERERLGEELYRHGCVPVTMEVLRATIIDDLWNLYPDDVAEQKANDFEDLWQKQEMHEIAMEEWAVQERERLLDEEGGADAIDPVPAPKSLVSARQKAKATLQLNEVTQRSERVRKLSAEMTLYSKRQNAMMVRMQMRGWHGFEDLAPPAFERGEDGLMTEECQEAMFEKFGQRTYEDVERFVTRLFDLPAVEVGNSASPPAKPSPESGSPEPSDVSVTSNGNSTNTETATAPSSSATAPVLAGASETIIEPSSDSTSLSEPATTQPGQMDAATSTSQSS